MQSNDNANKIYKVKDAIVSVDGSEVKGLSTFDESVLDDFKVPSMKEFRSQHSLGTINFSGRLSFSGNRIKGHDGSNWRDMFLEDYNKNEDYNLCEYDYIEDGCELYIDNVLLYKINIGFKFNEPGVVYVLGVDNDYLIGVDKAL